MVIETTTMGAANKDIGLRRHRDLAGLSGREVPNRRLRFAPESIMFMCGLRVSIFQGPRPTFSVESRLYHGGQLVLVQSRLHAAAQSVHLPPLNEVAQRSDGSTALGSVAPTTYAGARMTWTGPNSSDEETSSWNRPTPSNKPPVFSGPVPWSALSWTAVNVPKQDCV